MNLSATLQQHLDLCEEIHLLLHEENRLLQNTRRPPGADFLERKRGLLPRLDVARVAVIIGRMTHAAEIPQHRAIIARLQKKMLSLLLLDRENEKLLLKCSVQTEAGRSVPQPGSPMVTRAYSAAAAR